MQLKSTAQRFRVVLRSTVAPVVGILKRWVAQEQHHRVASALLSDSIAKLTCAVQAQVGVTAAVLAEFASVHTDLPARPAAAMFGPARHSLRTLSLPLRSAAHLR